MTVKWLKEYIINYKMVIDSIPLEKVEELISVLENSLDTKRQIFVFGNGGSASNSSHFITDLGKGASDVVGVRFKCMSLNENISWITALGNDYAYEDIFMRQLENYADPDDIVLTMSVSGNSPNLVNAINWANQNNLHTIALVGGKKGQLADIAKDVIVIDSTHYGHVEDAHMLICHMLTYAFMEDPKYHGI